jgi:hypothetical protein
VFVTLGLLELTVPSIVDATIIQHAKVASENVTNVWITLKAKIVKNVLWEVMEILPNLDAFLVIATDTVIKTRDFVILKLENAFVWTTLKDTIVTNAVKTFMVNQETQVFAS